MEGSDEDALNQLMPLVYDELHRLAGAYLRRKRGDHTLQPTALVNEAFLKFIDQRRIALILERRPPEFSFASDLSPDLQQVIRTALGKARTERYANIKDFASDLKRLRRELRHQDEIEVLPELLYQETQELNADRARREITSGRGPSSLFLKLKSQAQSTAEYLKEHKTAAMRRQSSWASIRITFIA
jgi:hypothetical protein